MEAEGTGVDIVKMLIDVMTRDTSMNHIVIDIEIKNSPTELPNGWDDTHKMGVSVAVVYEYETGLVKIYGDNKKDLSELRQRIEKADRVSGWNIWGFDYPVIYGFSRSEWKSDKYGPVNDIKAVLQSVTNDGLRRCWIALGLDPDEFVPKTHGGWGLDKVSKSTLGKRATAGKAGDGAMAPGWYKLGMWSKLISYCIADVRLERELIDFIDRYGYVLNDQRRLELLPQAMFSKQQMTMTF